MHRISPVKLCFISLKVSTYSHGVAVQGSLVCYALFSYYSNHGYTVQVEKQTVKEEKQWVLFKGYEFLTMCC